MAGSASEVLTSADERLTGIDKHSFRMLVENTADGILVVDFAGTVLYANPAASQILDHSYDELIHFPLGRPIASGEIAEITVHRAGKKPKEVEMRVVEIVWDGRAAILASLRDVSARRAQEQKQRQSQKLEAIGRLTAGIVHDFNNLLAAVQSGLLLLEKEIARNPGHPNVSMLMEEIRRRTQNGGALTQQLLAFSRQQPLSPEVLDLNGRIESLTTLLERTLGGGVRIDLDLDPALDRVLLDANQLDIALLNLAVNARDAMDGSGVLTLETSNTPEITDDAELARLSFVRVTVRDTGCGMTKDVMAKVFEPFFTTKAEGEGTGLGLSQVYGFVHQSGGYVRIDSELNRGTSVHLFLPRAQTAPGD